tara:strand:- start:62 stop:1606 length:1545 start_codon:yes stop_codon:yes gene_type:complete
MKPWSWEQVEQKWKEIDKSHDEQIKEANTFKTIEEQSDEDELGSHLADRVEVGIHNLGVKHYNVRGLLSEASSFFAGVKSDLDRASYFKSHPLDFNQKGKAIVSQILKSKDYWADKSTKGAQIIGSKFNIDPRISGLTGGLAFEALSDIGISKAFSGYKSAFTSGPGSGPNFAYATSGNLLSNSAAIAQKDGSLFSNLSKIEIQTPFSNIKKGMSVSESIKAAGSTKWFNKISKRYQYLKPADIVQDKNLIKLLKQNEHVLVGYNNKLKDLLNTKNSLLKQYPDYKTRPKDIINKIKNLDDTIGETKKFITETAGANPFLTGGGNVRIYGKGIRKYIKKNFPEFDDNLNRWHHIHGSADIGKSHLTKLTQDPWVKVNLFKHMEKNDIFSSGTINNLALIKETPHNKLHAAAKKLKIEPTHFVEKLNRWSNTELTFYQYIEDISKEVLAGNADINELFTMFESYGKAMKQINNELFETFGAKRFKDVDGLVEFVSQSKVAPSVIERQAIKKVTND